jgi:hypothetical protein
VVTDHGEVVAVGLGSRRRRGERGVENGAALRDFGGALRHELELELELIQTQIAQKPMLQAEVYHKQPYVFQRYPGVAPGRQPYVRLTNAEGPLSHKLARTPFGAAIFFARPMMFTSGARPILVRAPAACGARINKYRSFGVQIQRTNHLIDSFKLQIDSFLVEILSRAKDS